MAVTNNDLINNQLSPISQTFRLQIMMVIEELRNLKDRASISRRLAQTDSSAYYWGGYIFGVEDAIKEITLKYEIN